MFCHPTLLRRLRRGLIRPLAVAGLLAAALALPAAATPITYSFSGTVVDDSAGRGYTSFAGSFVFDSATADAIADTSTAAYAHNASPYGITLAFDGGSAFSYGSAFNVLVSNDLAGFDQWGLLGQDGSASLSLTLTDFAAQVFASDALPTQALTLASFQWATLSWEADGDTLNGQLSSLSCSAGCDGGSGGSGGSGGGQPLPSPGSLPLVVTALLGLWPALRRGQRP